MYKLCRKADIHKLILYIFSILRPHVDNYLFSSSLQQITRFYDSGPICIFLDGVKHCNVFTVKRNFKYSWHNLRLVSDWLSRQG
jgi:hypothetical protein